MKLGSNSSAATTVCSLSLWERGGVRGYGLSRNYPLTRIACWTMLRIARAIRPLPMGEVNNFSAESTRPNLFMNWV
jgi:hypothetical protein